MNENEKRKVFEELLEEYQNVIESEFSYEDGEREAERKAWLNKYNGIREPFIKDEKIRKAVRAWAEANGFEADYGVKYYLNACSLNSWQADIEFNTHIGGLKDEEKYTIAELCGEEKE